jgi:excisionase family DNA binding protein
VFGDRIRRTLSRTDVRIGVKGRGATVLLPVRLDSAQIASVSMDEYLTVAEIAELLKINPQTVRNWIDRRELPAVRVGQRRVRVRQSDLDAFLTSGATSAPEVEHATGEDATRSGRASAQH